MTVAVKKLRVAAMGADDIADFNREVAFLHALPFHEHVLQLHGVAVDETAGAYWMVMGWMEGGSVHGLLSSSRSDPASLPLSRRLQLCVECALGINHLHQLQPPVVHRDIKSMNFLLDKHGQVKVGQCTAATTQRRACPCTACPLARKRCHVHLLTPHLLSPLLLLLSISLATRH